MRRALITALLFLCGSAVLAETVAVIGTGRMGSAIGPRMAELGHTVVYGSREPGREDVAALVGRTGGDASARLSADAIPEADIVILAVPWAAVEGIVASVDNWSGKLIIDMTNPMQVGEDGYFFHPLDEAGAQKVARWATGATVVKAFSTVGSFAIADLSSAGGPVTVQVAADDRDAKCRVMQLGADLGFESYDAGPLKHAKILEDSSMLFMLNFSHGTLADTSHELHRRKNDNYKNAIAMMPDDQRPPWARGEPMVPGYQPCEIE